MRVLRVVLAAVAVVLLLEGGLRVWALFATDRGAQWRPGAEARILCLGDSHTFGGGVPETDSYPAQLQTFLDELEPGRFSVMNLGIPGMNSAQVRSRFAANLARYLPDVVVVWSGANERWNGAEFDLSEAGLGARIDALSLNSRVYRLVRVWMHDRRMARASTDAVFRADGRHQAADLQFGQKESRLPLGSVEEVIEHAPPPDADAATLRERSYRELTAMASIAGTAGVRLVLVQYPQRHLFAPLNKVVAQVAREQGIPFVDTSLSLQRVPLDQREWLWAAHPSGPIYREIARDVMEAVLGLD